MASLMDQICYSILTEAVSSEIGIIIKIESPKPIPSMTLRAKQILYKFKKMNSDFANLSIKFDPQDPDHKLWIVKTNQPNEESET